MQPPPPPHTPFINLLPEYLHRCHKIREQCSLGTQTVKNLGRRSEEVVSLFRPIAIIAALSYWLSLQISIFTL
jgi:hypothetical protein